MTDENPAGRTGTAVRAVGAPELSVYLIARQLIPRLPAHVVALPGPVPSVVRLTGAIDDAALLDAGLTWERYLDRHRVIYDQRNPGSRLLAERYLYEAVGDAYDHQIDTAQNRAAISRMVARLGPGRLIDYGCGTGISADVLGEDRFLSVGVDISPTMRAIAERRGLRTTTVEDLASAPEGCFDGAFACYVLHLTSSHEHLPHVARAVRRGGRIAANFHKGRGLAEASAILAQWDYEIVARTPRSQSVPAPEVIWKRR
ncbi:class I SAM-dependent methyltransferase [Actinoplanes sp. NEAU-A12]|uniref:Class I SAM-dependent methyltransferase n=1 Tax=Actinoplanes sandaracinus TaxID=3045177 RepID=A0ABT6WX43_9ACTN|nr:class I SAM-dependent methyltransferase [Actinoplanes sandaracinus]MDI6104302.1 class I SAM-dependent methyltransferase [Actinoplanes sandaracinus]